MEIELTDDRQEAGFFSPDETEDTEAKEPAIARLLRFAESQNIAEELESGVVDKIGQAVVREYEIDDASRAEWLTAYDKAMDIARQAIEAKSYPWPNAANIKYPLITTAAIQFHARAYPAIVQGNNVAKGAVIGYDMDGSKAKRAERIGKHLSYQLLHEMVEWEEEMDKLLLIFSIVGSDFKKTYYDPIKKRNVSERISAKDVVVNYWAKSIDTAPRVTHKLELYPYQIEERTRAGLFSKLDLPNVGDDPQKTELFLEQHRLEDLDKDGYPEPYCITVHKETGKVARIMARYDEDAIFVEGGSISELKRRTEQQNQQIQTANMQMFAQFRQHVAAYQQGMTQLAPMEPQFMQPVEMDLGGAEVQRIEPIQYFTQYSFMPSLDGGFYGAGFGTLLLGLNEGINANINQMLDAGHLANVPSGFAASNLKLAKKSGGNVRFEFGEFKRVDTNGMNIRDAIVYNQFPGPSAVLFNLLGMLIEAGRDVASVKDIMTGEASANMPATTTIALIEQGQQVFSSIYKRIHRALKSELTKLFKLNARYLPPRAYFTVLDAPEPIEITIRDYQQGDVDVAPVSDPNLVTKAQKMAQAQAMMPMAGDPTMDGMKIKMDYLGAIGVPNPQDYRAKQPPGPPPEMVEAMEKLKMEQARFANEQRETSAKILKMMEEVMVLRSQAIKNIADAEAAEIGAQVGMYNAQLEAVTAKTGEETDDAGIRPGNERGQGMAGEPGDAAIPQLPGGGAGAMGQMPAGTVQGAGPAELGLGPAGAPGEGGAAGEPGIPAG